MKYKDLLREINPAIGYMRLTDIRPQHLNNFYEQLSQNGVNKRTGGKLANSTIIEYHKIISAILSQAVKEMLIVYNVASKTTPPKIIKKEPN